MPSTLLHPGSPGFQVHGAQVWASTNDSPRVEPGRDRLRARCNACTAKIRERNGGRGGRKNGATVPYHCGARAANVIDNIRRAESSSLVRKFHGSSKGATAPSRPKQAKCLREMVHFRGVSARAGSGWIQGDGSAQSRPARQHRGTVGNTRSASALPRERKRCVGGQMQRVGRTGEKTGAAGPTASELS